MKKDSDTVAKLRGWKLVRLRKNGTLGPLFINRRQVLSIGHWMTAEKHVTPGYAVRPGWHATSKPKAPHLTEKNRIWIPVELEYVRMVSRPVSQGGLWYIAERMRIPEFEEWDTWISM